VTGIVASTLDLPELAAAVAARGLRLVPIAAARPADHVAALVGSPGEDPAACVAEARAKGWTGPLVLAMRSGCIARALDAGADDAVLLPASVEEIAARLAARLRAGAAAIRVGELRIDPVERRVTRADRPIALLPREYALLTCLAEQPGRCVGRAELLRKVWKLGFDPGTNVIEVHVSRLRAKLDRGFDAPMLLTEKGRGYLLRA
jgi:two-component system, OmpR family, response regulator